MKSLNLPLAFFLLLLSFFKTEFSCSCEQQLRHQIFIGPEIYGVKRSREGGTEQTGILYGVRAGYDYIRRYAFYWGIDGLYASGALTGENGENQKIKSQLTDSNIEGRFGYNFQSKSCLSASFIPFIGVGYFWENNDYKHPSPLKVKFENSFFYVPVGFLSRIFVNPQLSIGLNFKARFIIEGKTKVSNDSELELEEGDLTLHYEEKTQYRVDLPVSYYFCWLNKPVSFAVSPFYEYRQYGHRANFPFDFLETEFNIYGVTVRLGYLF